MTKQSTQTVIAPTPDFARIVKRAAVPKKEAKAPAGDYRVIHGRIAVPRYAKPADAREALLNGEPTMEYAREGDIIHLGPDDATRMLADNIVETLDAKPSRVGKVWEPPKVTRNKNLGSAAQV